MYIPIANCITVFAPVKLLARFTLLRFPTLRLNSVVIPFGIRWPIATLGYPGPPWNPAVGTHMTYDIIPVYPFTTTLLTSTSPSLNRVCHLILTVPPSQCLIL